MNTRISLIGLGLAIALFLALNVLAAPALRGVRADLTEQKLYTLSRGTRNIVGDLEEPIKLRFFFARSVAEEAPPLLAYAERVQEMLEEYVAASGGKIDLEVIDPEPYSEAEELAVGFGIEGRVANSEGDRFYMGIVGTNSVDDEEVLPILDQNRESFLEYELTEMIDRLENPELPVVGLLTSLPLRGGPAPAMQPGQQPQQLPPWPILDVVSRRYEIRDLPLETLTEIPDDIDLLLMIHPKGIEPEGLYAVDQFALAGGKVVAFVDPFCYMDPKRQSGDPMAALEAGVDSGVDPLLLAWGVALKPGRIVGDTVGGLTVRNAQQEPVRMPLAFGIESEFIDDEDILTSPLDTLRFFLPGSVSRSDDAPEGATVETLFTTSEEGGGTVDSMTLIGPLDPQIVSDSFIANEPRLPLGVRVSGTVRTAFPDGPPGADEPQTADDTEAAGDTAESEGEDEAEEVADAADGHLTESAAPFNALVFADVDMLHDSVWATPFRNIFGQIQLQPTADNAALLVSSLENLAGSSDLISLRSRAGYTRPFTLKEELLRDAQERYRAEELELEAKLADTQAKLDELQKEKDPSSALILSEEQEEQIVQFRQEQVETRRALRKVKRDLRAEIDALGTRLKLLNIFLVPAIIAAAVASWRLARSTRKGGASA